MSGVLTITAPDVDTVTHAEALRITGEARAALRNVIVWAARAAELIEQAWGCRADQALGYESWARYCEVEFALARELKWPIPQRVETVAALREVGMSSRAVASAIGVDQATVVRDLKAARTPVGETSSDAGASDEAPETVLGLDGRQRPARVTSPRQTEPAPRRFTTDRIVELIEAAGADGLTVREVCRRLRLHHGQASGALSRLEVQRRVIRPGERRDGSSVYVVSIQRPTPVEVASAPSGATPSVFSVTRQVAM